MIRKTIILSILLSVFAGCESDRTDMSNVKVNANVIETDAANSNANTAETAEPGGGGVLVLSGSGKSENYDCNGRDVEIDESTTANKFILTGECKTLKVDGVSNRVFVDKVGEIEVIGTSNKVYYGEGLDKKEPKITKKGTSLIVEQKEKAEKAEKEKPD